MTEATVVLHPYTRTRFDADPDDIDQVRHVAESVGARVEWSHGEARTVRVSGDDDALKRLSDELAEHNEVVAVLGVGPQPKIRPHIKTRSTAPASLSALDVAKAYSFPESDGAGQRIAIIELGGGFGRGDLDHYFGQLGLPVPTVNSVPVAGGQNKSDGPSGADGEVLLDIEVAGAVAPGAVFDVYFGPNTDQGFLSAINGAIHSGADVISISWGGPENSWPAATLKAFDQAFAQAAAAGINVFCAAGDNGSGDGAAGQNADFPAASPHVVACGGTRLEVNSDGTLASESVWNDNPYSSASGGGYSAQFAKPGYQSVVPGQMRGLPDISGNADPNSGYQVYVDGQSYVIGGTSAVAPLLAGLSARLNKLSGKRVGFLNPPAYGNPTAFRDVTQGNNGAYRAGAGWDPASGLGSVDGSKLLAALGTPAPGPAPDPGPAPTPTPTPTSDGYSLVDFTAAEKTVIERRAKHAFPHDTLDDATRKWLEARIRAALR